MKVYSKLFTKEGTLNVNKAVKNAQTEKVCFHFLKESSIVVSRLYCLLINLVC